MPLSEMCQYSHVLVYGSLTLQVNYSCTNPLTASTASEISWPEAGCLLSLDTSTSRCGMQGLVSVMNDKMSMSVGEDAKVTCFSICILVFFVWGA